MSSRLKKTLILFIILQPFLDIFWLYQDPIASFLGMSPATIIRLIFVAVIGILFVFFESRKKLNFFMLGYSGLLLVYFVFHQWNSNQFHSLVPGNFAYSTFGELFYIVRMVMPLFIMIVAYNADINEDGLERITHWLSGLFAGCVVVTNLLTISLGSYLHDWTTKSGTLAAEYQKQKITENVITWFTGQNKGGFYTAASKGFFNHANTISAVFLLLTPFVLYFFMTRLNWKNGLMAVVQVLANLELGTKAAEYGTVAILGIFFVMYLYFALIHREFKFNYKALLALVVLGIGFMGMTRIAPSSGRQSAEETVVAESGKRLEVPDAKGKVNLTHKLKQVEASGSRKKLVKFIYKYRGNYGLNEDFVTKDYPAKDDPYFWLGVMKWPMYERINYRHLQDRIWRRVASINNNGKDKLFGFGYIRLNNMGLIERDFVSHYYAVGFVGIILLVLPYVLVFVAAGLLMLLHFRKRVTMLNVTFMLALALVLGLSVYAGYVMDYLTATILLGFYMGQLLRRATGKQDDTPTSLGSTMRTIGR